MLPQVCVLGYTLQSYYLCAALAGALGIFLSFIFLKNERLGPWRVLLPVLTAVFSLIGARLLNYLLNTEAYGSDFPIWSFSYRNLSLMGGLLFGAAAILVYGLAARRNPFRLFDCMVLPVAAAIISLKLGCFLNGCCFGKPTDSFLGMTFPANTGIYNFLDKLPLFTEQTRTVYPTQLFELFGAVIGLAVILPVFRRRVCPDGARAVVYAIWFTLVRLLVHPFRSFPYDKLVTLMVYPIFYCIILLILLITLFVLLVRKKLVISSK